MPAVRVCMHVSLKSQYISSLTPVHMYVLHECAAVRCDVSSLNNSNWLNLKPLMLCVHLEFNELPSQAQVCYLYLLASFCMLVSIGQLQQAGKAGHVFLHIIQSCSTCATNMLQHQLQCNIHVIACMEADTPAVAGYTALQHIWPIACCNTTQ